MLKVVIDTNIWVRTLLGGKLSSPVLESWKQDRFQVIVSETMLAELEEVCQRPRLRKIIRPGDLNSFLEQLRFRGTVIEPKTTPPPCRDPDDKVVLATAIDGQANAIVTGDDDLRAEDALREAMAKYGVELWGIETLLERIKTN